MEWKMSKSVIRFFLREITGVCRIHTFIIPRSIVNDHAIVPAMCQLFEQYLLPRLQNACHNTLVLEVHLNRT